MVFSCIVHIYASLPEGISLGSKGCRDEPVGAHVICPKLVGKISRFSSFTGQTVQPSIFHGEIPDQRTVTSPVSEFLFSQVSWDL